MGLHSGIIPDEEKRKIFAAHSRLAPASVTSKIAAYPDSMRFQSLHVKMSTFSVTCPLCDKVFKTYSLKKHVRERHDGTDEDSLVPVFKDDKGEIFQFTPEKSLGACHQSGYQTWLAGLTERMNSTFHPRLPGEFFVSSKDILNHLG